MDFYVVPQSQCSWEKGGLISSCICFWNHKSVLIWYSGIIEILSGNNRSLGEVCLHLYNFRQMTQAGWSASTTQCCYVCICFIVQHILSTNFWTLSIPSTYTGVAYSKCGLMVVRYNFKSLFGLECSYRFLYIILIIFSCTLSQYVVAKRECLFPGTYSFSPASVL